MHLPILRISLPVLTGSVYQSGEGPVFENGKLKVWQHAWLPDRVFPIDLNGFAVNSSQIGIGRPIAPREYHFPTKLASSP
jgi:hypothetical protein